MGISLGRIKLLDEAIKFHNVKQDKIISYGVQDIRSNYNEVVDVIKKLGKNIDNKRVKEKIHQDEVFKMLGFKEVESIDYYPHEKPTYTLDLNKPIPNEMIGQYNFVYDGGTTEHCFNVPRVLENTVKLLKKDGVALHCVPMSGQIGHGFYQFSPTIFYDFYSVNGFSDFKTEIYIKLNGKEYLYEPFNYKIDEMVNVPRDFFGARVLIHFTAKKIEELNEIVYPIQAQYKSHFEVNEGKNVTKPKTSGIKSKIRNFIEKNFPQFYLYYVVKKRTKRIDI